MAAVPEVVRYSSSGRTPTASASTARALSSSSRAVRPSWCNRTGSAHPESTADSNISRAAGCNDSADAASRYARSLTRETLSPTCAQDRERCPVVFGRQSHLGRERRPVGSNGTPGVEERTAGPAGATRPAKRRLLVGTASGARHPAADRLFAGDQGAVETTRSPRGCIGPDRGHREPLDRCLDRRPDRRRAGLGPDPVGRRAIPQAQRRRPPAGAVQPAAGGALHAGAVRDHRGALLLHHRARQRRSPRCRTPRTTPSTWSASSGSGPSTTRTPSTGSRASGRPARCTSPPSCGCR